MKGWRAGACGRTCIVIVGSISSAPSRCASTTVTRSHVVGRRARGHAPAQHLCGTCTCHFLVHMCRYWGTRGKPRRASAGSGTCTGTYANQHRLLTIAPAQYFGVRILYIDHFVVHMYRYGGDDAQEPARRHQQRDRHRHVFQSASTATKFTGIAIRRYRYVSSCGTYVSLWRNEGQASARWRRQRDMHRPLYQSSWPASWCTGRAILLFMHVSFYRTCVSVQRDEGQVPTRRANKETFTGKYSNQHRPPTTVVNRQGISEVNLCIIL